MPTIPLFQPGHAPAATVNPTLPSPAGHSPFKFLGAGFEAIGKELQDIADKRQQAEETAQAIKIHTEAAGDAEKLSRDLIASGIPTIDRPKHLREGLEKIRVARQAEADKVGGYASNKFRTLFAGLFHEHVLTGEKQVTEDFVAEKRADWISTQAKAEDLSAMAPTDAEVEKRFNETIAEPLGRLGQLGIYSKDTIAKMKEHSAHNVRKTRLHTKILDDPLNADKMVEASDWMSQEEKNEARRKIRAEIEHREIKARQVENDARKRLEQDRDDAATEFVYAGIKGEDVRTHLSQPHIFRFLGEQRVQHILNAVKKFNEDDVSQSDEGTFMHILRRIGDAQSVGAGNSAMDAILQARGDKKLTRDDTVSLFGRAISAKGEAVTRGLSLQQQRISEGEKAIDKFLSTPGQFAMLSPSPQTTAQAILRYRALMDIERGSRRAEDPFIVSLDVVKESVRALAFAQGFTMQEFSKSLQYGSVAEVEKALVRGEFKSKRDVDLARSLAELADQTKAHRAQTRSPGSSESPGAQSPSKARQPVKKVK